MCVSTNILYSITSHSTTYLESPTLSRIGTNRRRVTLFSRAVSKSTNNALSAVNWSLTHSPIPTTEASKMKTKSTPPCKSFVNATLTTNCYNRWTSLEGWGTFSVKVSLRVNQKWNCWRSTRLWQLWVRASTKWKQWCMTGLLMRTNWRSWTIFLFYEW